jgi:hypothetical protein
LISCGFVRGMSFIVRQMKNTRRPMKMIGAHVMIQVSISYHSGICARLLAQHCGKYAQP